MTDTIEIAVWKDTECSLQIVEFDLHEGVCKNIDVFLNAVNNYLVDQGYIEEKSTTPLTNLEFSEVSAITSSKEILHSSNKKDPETGLFYLVESNFKALGIYNR